MHSDTDLAEALADLLEDLVHIPSGAIRIGSTEEEVARELRSPDLAGVRPEWLRKELPRRTVIVPSFLIGRTPVTVDQAEALAPWTGVKPIAPAGGDHPASLSVPDAFQFCAAVSDLAGRQISPPSEEEWVRAARGDDDRTYPWGDRWDTQRANLIGTGIGTTTAVGSFPSGASPFGVLDLAGNADELTRTVYRPFPGAPEDVPLLETWARSPFVTKGGGFLHARDLARIDRRHGIYADGEPLALRLAVTIR
jgi:formylglycine-generating enzyme required for sulfatase activity